MLNVVGRETQPCHHGFFFHPFDPMNGCQAVAVGQHRQALQDCFRRPMPPIEYGTDSFDKCLPTGFAMIALRSSRGAAKLADVARIDLAVRTTRWVPTEAARRRKLSIVHSRSLHF